MTSVVHNPRICFFWLLFAQLVLMVVHVTELPWWIWPLWGMCYGCAIFTKHQGVKLCCKDGPRFPLFEVY